jgi:hypothetical protein
MSKSARKLLLILLSLALAVSPLRGAWALPMTATADSESHCAQMQQDMNHADPVMGMNDGNTASGHPCNDDCNGNCCDSACTTCTHATPALSYTAFTTPGAYRVFLNNISSDAFPERTVIPPLRPPATLHG